jgi:Xaa-Pro aminopeptidase
MPSAAECAVALPPDSRLPIPDSSLPPDSRPSSMPSSRREALRRLLVEKKLPALLVTDETNVSYLTGFTGDSSFLLVTPERELLISDQRYTQQLEEECPGLELAIRGPGSRLPDFTAEVVGLLNLPRLGIEGEAMTVAFHEKLRKVRSFPPVAPVGQPWMKAGPLITTAGLVESLREIKDAGEIATIRQAVRVAEQAFATIRGRLAPGRTEKEIADELEFQIRLGGGTCGAFPSIVGVGPRAALPHGRPIEGSRIGDHDFVLIDWGARYQLYHSDLTRILVTGKLSPQLQTVYGVVLTAQRAAIAAIRPGAVMKDVDRAARAVIEDAGYGPQFGHSLGHGIGLAVHEQPRLAPDQDRKLAPGMVVTVEPGIYLPGWGGVRIEDDVLVTDDGHEVLTNVPKELEECIVQ